jgi:serine protease Do
MQMRNPLRPRDASIKTAGALASTPWNRSDDAAFSFDGEELRVPKQESSMDETSDAADMERAAALPRPIARAGMFALAALAGVLVGVLGARGLASQSFTAHLRPSSAAAQLVTHPGSTPASFADVVDAVKPAVIGVEVRLPDNSNDRSAPQSPRDRFSRRFGAPPPPDLPAQRPDRIVIAQGSGFFISADGYAVTNNHVVEGSGSIEIQTNDQKSYPAKVVGADPMSDLALLKVDGRNDFVYVELADATPRVGDWVLAVGNPFGLGGTVTAGIVSARERDIGADSNDHLIQIDASINQGDSGGPSFGLDGRVIGVNTMIFSPSGGSIGIAFAIPADTVKTVIPQLRDKGSVTRGWLGVQAQPVTAEIADSLGLKEAHGALVAEPQPDSPAAKAGIAPGDVIASIDGAPIKDARDLSKAVGNTAPGRSIKLGILRQGKERTITVTLGQVPSKRLSSAGSEPSGPAPNGERETTGRGGLGAPIDGPKGGDEP